MSEHQVARTLVKSPPELWEVCSDPARLGRHLEAFGEIRITRLEPETTVAWEGERASGTVRIEASGWGTRVILTAESASGGPVTPPASNPVELVEPEPPVVELEPAVPEPIASAPEPSTPEPEPPTRRGFWRRLGRMFVANAVVSVPIPEDDPPQLAVEPPPAPESPRAATSPEPASAPPPPEPASAPPPPEPDLLDALAALEAALDSLGQDHHRPFSRA